ncbi:MAG: hypothetical protein NVS1B14_06070 [Vulcanimicrobiaceae bacterium]
MVGSDSLTRRVFLGGVAAAGGALLIPGCTSGGSRTSGRERVVIVGAGIAGLCTALTLADAGIAATLYESSNRIGGRMHSERGYWDDGQHTEWCGAMIDSAHQTLHALARRFHIPLLDTVAAWPRGARDTAYLRHRYYPMQTADKDFRAIYPVLQKQLHEMGETVTYARATPAARKLDAMSIAQWIAAYVPGGAQSEFGRLIKEGYRNEYGREIEELSAINVVQMLGAQKSYLHAGEVNVLGYSDQRYITDGGNQRIPLAIAGALPEGSIRLQRRLVALRKRPGGVYELHFSDSDGKTEAVEADRVVLALPFIALRGVDYSGAGFDALKHKAIQTLGYGYHTKLHVQFKRRAWQDKGRWPYPTTGQVWTDLRFQNSIDFSLGQPGRSGIIERFTGSAVSMLDTPPVPYAKISDSPAVGRHVREFLAQLDEIYPGVSRYWNGKATFGNAQADPNILASYSSWLVGQCTTIAGYERVRQGRVHFAGEHTSVEFQGFMEGGAKSGVDAAKEILADYRITSRALAVAAPA